MIPSYLRKLRRRRYRIDYEALAAELIECLVDVCWQGTGEQPLSSETWHQFLSAYEDADDLLRRPEVRRLRKSGLVESNPFNRQQAEALAKEMLDHADDVPYMWTVEERGDWGSGRYRAMGTPLEPGQPLAFAYAGEGSRAEAEILVDALNAGTHPGGPVTFA